MTWKPSHDGQRWIAVCDGCGVQQAVAPFVTPAQRRRELDRMDWEWFDIETLYCPADDCRVLVAQRRLVDPMERVWTLIHRYAKEDAEVTMAMMHAIGQKR